MEFNLHVVCISWRKFDALLPTHPGGDPLADGHLHADLLADVDGRHVELRLLLLGRGFRRGFVIVLLKKMRCNMLLFFILNCVSLNAKRPLALESQISFNLKINQLYAFLD